MNSGCGGMGGWYYMPANNAFCSAMFVHQKSIFVKVRAGSNQVPIFVIVHGHIYTPSRK